MLVMVINPKILYVGIPGYHATYAVMIQQVRGFVIVWAFSKSSNSQQSTLIPGKKWFALLSQHEVSASAMLRDRLWCLACLRSGKEPDVYLLAACSSLNLTQGGCTGEVGLHSPGFGSSLERTLPALWQYFKIAWCCSAGSAG